MFSRKLGEGDGLFCRRSRFLLLLRFCQTSRFTQLTMAVNLSVRQLRDAAFAEQALAVINESGLPANQIELEITESIAFARDKAIVSNVDLGQYTGIVSGRQPVFFVLFITIDKNVANIAGDF